MKLKHAAVLLATAFLAACGGGKQEGIVTFVGFAPVTANDKDIRTVETSTTSELMTLTIEWKDRELAARWASELVRRANELMRARAIADASSSIAYLKSELDKTNVLEVRQAIYSLAESHFKTMALAKAREEYYFRVVDPAVAPDRDDWVSPKRALMIAAAVVGGAMLGLMVVIFLNALGPARREPPRG